MGVLTSRARIVSSTPAFPTIPGMVFAAEVFRETAYTDGNAISSLADQSGNGITFDTFASSPSGRTGPIYKASIINGRAVARFASDKGLKTVGIAQSQPNTIVWVGTRNTTAGERVWDTGNFRHIGQTKTTETTIYAGTALTTTSLHPVVSEILVGLYNSTVSKIYGGGGSAVVTGNAGTDGAGSTGVFYLGSDTGTAYFDGDTAAIYFIHGTFDANSLNTLGSYLQTVFGITWTTITPFTTITDSFNRADSTTTMGSTDTGQTWTVLSGTWGITSNTGYCVATNLAQNHVVLDSGVADCTVGVTLSTVGDGGVAFRAIDNNNLFIVASASGGQNVLYRRTAGGFTALSVVNSVPVNGDAETVVLSGTSIIVKVNGSTVHSVTDSQGSTTTNHGLRAYATACRFDNFSVTVP